MAAIPLAERMRPQQLENLAGQKHLTGNGSILRTAVEGNMLPSIILWGPPGVGKTTIAHIIAHTMNLPFYPLSAISSGVKDIREVIESAAKQKKAIVFIDEIHRFNKGQQDALLGAVEKGIITLIGATTENPSFEVNAALLSRCQVYVLKPLEKKDLLQLIQKALTEDEILKQLQVEIKENDALINLSGGDARKLYNLLELAVLTQDPLKPILIDDDAIMKIAQRRVALYDKKGEQHYDIISAFIKSMRGSDPNAAVYWLARMIEGGEDCKFIARRMLIFASEDIGNANPNALLLANACFDAVNKIGYPEARIILSQCVIYLATSIKSNASYLAIGEALSAVNQFGDLPVPLPIRNAPTGLMKDHSYGKGYKYGHNYEGNFTKQEYLPEKIKGTCFYQPGKNAKEDETKKNLRNWWGNKYNY